MDAYAPQPPARTSPLRVARRVFLVGTGGAAALALGWAFWPREERLAIGAAPGESVLNHWLKIGKDGVVTVIVPQAEMGQGAPSALAQILADELGADWNRVVVESAPVAPVYANRGIAIEPIAELPAILQGPARMVSDRAIGYFELQLTGGSTSVRGYYEPLRAAGATARAMLCAAAAARWDVSAAACDTAGGAVVNGPRSLPFGAIAEEAALLAPPAQVTLRPVALGGRSAPRLDVPAKVDGGAIFGADVRLPGMVYAAIRNGPAGSYAMPGFRGPVPQGAIGITRGPGWLAVTAPTWWAANRAAEAIEPAFPAAPFDSDTFMTRLERALDTMPTLGGEGRLIEARYQVPFLAHATLEPQTATARVEPGRAELWAPTQSVWLTRSAVARALGLPEEAVSVYPTFIGGGFGRRAETDAAVQAATIARDMKRPVQLIYSREEDMIAARPRPAAAARMQARIDRSGNILGWSARVAAPSVIQSFSRRNMPAIASEEGSADPAAIEGMTRVPYRTGSYAAEHVLIESPVPIGFWRSVGHSYTGFFVESFVDELARAAGQDPLLYRLYLLEDAPRHAQALRAAADAAGYGPAMGCAVHASFGSIVAQVVEATLEPAPAVSRVTAAIACGRAINPDVIRQQIEGSIIYGLTAAMRGRLTYRNGYPEERNFDLYPLLMLAEAPAVETIILTGADDPIGGVGEPGVPPIAPAVANAFASLTGRRMRRLPLDIT